MTRIKLGYGKNGLFIDIPNADIISPRHQESLSDPEKAIKNKLYNPNFGKSLEQILSGKSTVAISFTDITRATPNNIIIPVLIGELRKCGIAKNNIVLINMTGSHRHETTEELSRRLGKDIVANYRIVQHNSFDKSSMTLAGYMGNQYPLYINSDFMAADVKICTGFIEPHFFAGFSGGPKAVLPGLSDIDSIMRNHNAVRIGDKNATWGITIGNPVWENIREGCSIVNPDFLINVALNSDAKITEIFTGEWEKAHQAGYTYVKANAMCKVNKLYDTVITTNSGYPLDMNLYQCVKGLSAAAEIVKDNGTIIIAGECSDGIPYGSSYQKILGMEKTPEKLFDLIISNPIVIPEQWQVQIQTKIQKRAKVYIYSDYLSDEEIKASLLLPCRNIEALVNELSGDVAILPEGPQAIPYLDNK